MAEEFWYRLSLKAGSPRLGTCLGINTWAERVWALCSARLAAVPQLFPAWLWQAFVSSYQDKVKGKAATLRTWRWHAGNIQTAFSLFLEDRKYFLNFFLVNWELENCILTRSVVHPANTRRHADPTPNLLSVWKHLFTCCLFLSHTGWVAMLIWWSHVFFFWLHFIVWGARLSQFTHLFQRDKLLAVVWGTIVFLFQWNMYLL